MKLVLRLEDLIRACAYFGGDDMGMIEPRTLLSDALAEAFPEGPTQSGVTGVFRPPCAHEMFGVFPLPENGPRHLQCRLCGDKFPWTSEP